MSIIGTVESLWRYPVKSMRGEELDSAFAGFAGIYGDRIFAIGNSSATPGFPYLTGREQQSMLLCRPTFRQPDRAARPVNLSAAESMGPGITPIYAEPSNLLVDVEMPSGNTLSIDDPALLEVLGEGVRESNRLSLMRSERALTDCRPVSLFSIQTARQLSDELSLPIDPRRFRANIYANWDSLPGFGEDSLVGRSIRIGSKVEIAVLLRDGRCKMVTLDPDTGEANPDVIRKLSSAHEGKAGVYGAVLVEGEIRKGDSIELID